MRTVNDKALNTTPTTFVIFGITGDLSKKKLLPALLDLYVKKLLPEKFRLVGLSRRELGDEEFHHLIREAINTKKHNHPSEIVEQFIQESSYLAGLFDDPQAYGKLAHKLKSVDDEFGLCTNKLFYLSVQPIHYETILNNLSESKLTIPCSDNLGWTRLLIEKPFGKDSYTAKHLDSLLGKLFKEEQIFRIDHYLAKETVQNVLAFRFSNTMFEPLWNKDHIDSIEIDLLEKGTAAGRGAFYDQTGALRDVGQNHLLQLFALITMEKPKSLACNDIRDERAKILGQLGHITHRNINKLALRGQYRGYQQEAGAAPNSTVETFFALRLTVDNRRWRGVPFYLRSGKGLDKNLAEIRIRFKDPDPDKTFVPHEYKAQECNTLTFRIQPDEGISILFWLKVPGFDNRVEPQELAFNYADSKLTTIIPDAYEKVLYDCIIGDQTLFTSTAEVLATWKFITPILESWHEVPLETYEVASDGPDIDKLKIK